MLGIKNQMPKLTQIWAFSWVEDSKKCLSSEFGGGVHLYQGTGVYAENCPAYHYWACVIYISLKGKWKLGDT